MVYRGLPSAGCENCRRGKKRCGLERPACHRCIKSNKICSGYRDTTSLQVRDETKAVKQKVEKQKDNATQSAKASSLASSRPSTRLQAPETSNSPRSTPSLNLHDVDDDHSVSNTVLDAIVVPSHEILGATDFNIASLILPASLKPQPDDVATNYFFHQFTSSTHWSFLRDISSSNLEPCLDLAIKACGMAALDNVQNVVMGREYARSAYAEALGVLNQNLRDPKLCKTDASLMSVAMLGYYENLTCEGRPSIQSWKAHVKGATQLLKIRGSNQFKTRVGRILFREMRAQILTQSIWDHTIPPDFLWEYQSELDAEVEDNIRAHPIDRLTRICLDYAVLRANIRKEVITDVEAAEAAAEVDRQFLQWSTVTNATGEDWRYRDLEVADSHDFWNGKVHAYMGHPVPTAWNTWRIMRIMLSRTQEWLCNRFQFSAAEREEQLQYFRHTRRQMTDDICATIPVQLGHGSPAYTSPCVLITAYGSVWPLFFAGTCALERVRMGAVEMHDGKPRLTPAGSSAAAQALWIMGRLEYIAQSIGLKWADAVAATLRGEFHIARELELKALGSNESDIAKDELRRSTPWIKDIESHSDPADYLIQAPGQDLELPIIFDDNDILPDIARDRRHTNGPFWLGHDQRRAEEVASGPS